MSARNRMSNGLSTLVLAAPLLFGACTKGAEQRPAPSVSSSDSATPAPGTAAVCPADGRWHDCSVANRLERSGLAPRRDSSAATEKPLSRTGVLFHLGSDELEVFVYPDSNARAADEKKLDSTQFVDAAAPLTIKRERTLIRSANLLGLLKSLSDHKRERVSDALMAGPPQPPK